MKGLWQRRVARAEALAARWPFAGQALRFLGAVTGAQAAVYEKINAHMPAGRTLEVELLLPHVPALLRCVEASGPAPLCAAGRALSEAGAWAGLLRAGWEGAELAAPEGFWAGALLHPYLVAAAARYRDGGGDLLQGERRCPFCGGAPLVGVLREDREAGAAVRWLCCGRCASRWRFPRVVCPGCGEEDPERLPRLSAEEVPWVRVEACETCRAYLKVVDLDREGEAEPVADELGSLPLDVFAGEQGYRKLAPNLIGV